MSRTPQVDALNERIGSFTIVMILLINYFYRMDLLNTIYYWYDHRELMIPQACIIEEDYIDPLHICCFMQ